MFKQLRFTINSNCDTDDDSQEYLSGANGIVDTHFKYYTDSAPIEQNKPVYINKIPCQLNFKVTKMYYPVRLPNDAVFYDNEPKLEDYI